jgi:hypothetical protein
VYWVKGDRMIGGEIAKILEKVAKTVAKTKKAQFESPKHLHQNPYKLLKIHATNHIFPQNSPGPNKSSPNDNIAPNLVTLIVLGLS